MDCLQWFDMSNAEMEMTRSVYLAVLREELPNPLAKESDEEGATGDEDSAQEGAGQTESLTIDFDGLNERIIDLPLAARNYSSLQVGQTGVLYYIERSGDNPDDGGGELKRYNLNTRKEEALASNINGFVLSADKKKLLYVSRSSWGRQV